MKLYYTQPEVVLIAVDQTQILTMNSGFNSDLEEIHFRRFQFD